MDTSSTANPESLASSPGGGNGTVQLSALKAGGSAALKTDTGAALASARDAVSQVAGIRGRLGGFQRFQVGSAINALQAAQIGLTDAASVIMDTDYALATSKLNREQILIQSGIQLLGIANQQAAQILSLL